VGSVITIHSTEKKKGGKKAKVELEARRQARNVLGAGSLDGGNRKKESAPSTSADRFQKVGQRCKRKIV